MQNSNLLTPIKSPPPSQVQLNLWSDKKAQVIEQITLQNKILTASKVPNRLALGDERYYLSLTYQFPWQFTRDEAEAAIAATEDWKYPQIEKLHAVIEAICYQGVRA